MIYFQEKIEIEECKLRKHFSSNSRVTKRYCPKAGKFIRGGQNIQESDKKKLKNIETASKPTITKQVEGTLVLPPSHPCGGESCYRTGESVTEGIKVKRSSQLQTRLG